MNVDRIKEPLTFSVPLAREAKRRVQERLKQKHLTERRARQVYFNVLSTYAVEYYLECMGFEVDRTGSDSANPVIREFADVADVMVRSIGKFECRPVLAGDRSVSVPLEVWCDRQGYFAVQLNADLTEATILGFLKNVTVLEVPLEEWRSLDDFLRYASRLESSVKLSQWLHHVFEAGWETAEAVLLPPKMVWRSGPTTAVSWRSPASGGAIERVKRLKLERAEDEVALLVRLSPKLDAEMGIGVEIYPTGDRTYLPQDLKLMVLDEDGIAVMQAEARSTKNIQLKFRGETGEEFSIKVALGDTSVTEVFTI